MRYSQWRRGVSPFKATRNAARYVWKSSGCTRAFPLLARPLARASTAIFPTEDLDQTGRHPECIAGDVPVVDPLSHRLGNQRIALLIVAETLLAPPGMCDVRVGHHHSSAIDGRVADQEMPAVRVLPFHLARLASPDFGHADGDLLVDIAGSEIAAHCVVSDDLGQRCPRAA